MEIIKRIQRMKNIFWQTFGFSSALGLARRFFTMCYSVCVCVCVCARAWGGGGGARVLLHANSGMPLMNDSKLAF